MKPAIFDLPWGDVKDERERFTKAVVFWSEYYKDLLDRKALNEVDTWAERAIMDEFMIMSKQWFKDRFEDVIETNETEDKFDFQETQESIFASMAVEGESVTAAAEPSIGIEQPPDQTAHETAPQPQDRAVALGASSSPPAAAAAEPSLPDAETPNRWAIVGRPEIVEEESETDMADTQRPVSISPVTDLEAETQLPPSQLPPSSE